MDIRKAFMKDGQLSISYRKDGNSYSIKSAETPRPELALAIEGLKGILYRNMEVFLPSDVERSYPDDVAYKEVKRSVARQERLRMVEHFRVIGLSHSQSEQNGDVYRGLGLYITSSNRIPISTGAMTVPEHGDEFWLAGNEPSAHLSYLTPDDCKAIERFMAAIEDFIAGGREQKELFDDSGDPTLDADNTGGDFTEDGEVVDFSDEDDEGSLDDDEKMFGEDA